MFADILNQSLLIPPHIFSNLKGLLLNISKHLWRGLYIVLVCCLLSCLLTCMVCCCLLLHCLMHCLSCRPLPLEVLVHVVLALSAWTFGSVMTRQLILFLVDLSAWFACLWIRHWLIFIIFCVFHSPIMLCDDAGRCGILFCACLTH